MQSAEGGFTLVTVAISVTALFAMAALAIDFGKLYLVRTQLQHAADSAALAAAYTFIDMNQPQPATANNAAITMASTAKTIAGQVTSSGVSVNVQTNLRKVT